MNQNMSNLTESIAYASYLNTINVDINNSLALIGLAIGVPGNLWSILVFARLISRHSKTKNNMALLYTILCIFDLISIVWINLVTKGYLSWSIFEWFTSFNSSAFCPLTNFMRRATLHFSSWMTVFITLDRYVFVFYPNRFIFLRSNKLALLGLVFLLFFLISLINIPNLFFYQTGATSASCTASFEIILASDLLSIITRTYIPLGFIVFFNIKMILKISHRKTTLLVSSFPISSISNNDSNKASRERLVTLAVISSGLIFFVTHFPISIVYILYDIQLYNSDEFRNTDPLVAAVYNLTFNCFVNFSVLDQIFSIVTYWLFNKIYCQEARRLLALCFTCLSNVSSSNSEDLNGSQNGKEKTKT